MTDEKARLLLQDGRTFDEPDRDTLEHIEALEGDGLVSGLRTKVFACVRPPGGLPAASFDPGCPGILEFQGVATPHRCDECGTEHWVDEDTPNLEADPFKGPMGIPLKGQ